MIRIQGDSFPLFYQIDNSQYLPSCVGAVQWNGTSKCFEVSTGSTWQRIEPTVEISMNRKSVEALKWAEKKMEEERELIELAKSNTAVADLLKQIDEKKEQLAMIKELVSNNG